MIPAEGLLWTSILYKRMGDYCNQICILNGKELSPFFVAMSAAPRLSRVPPPPPPTLLCC